MYLEQFSFGYNGSIQLMEISYSEQFSFGFSGSLQLMELFVITGI